MSNPYRWDLNAKHPLFDWESIEQTEGGTAVEVEDQANVAAHFAELAEQWRAGTRGVSILKQRVLHPAYLRIIALGSPAIPVLLRELEARPDYWFYALRALTGDDPVSPGDRGNLDAMTESWLRWGRETGYLE